MAELCDRCQNREAVTTCNVCGSKVCEGCNLDHGCKICEGGIQKF